jgi:hypothetical protein
MFAAGLGTGGKEEGYKGEKQEGRNEPRRFYIGMFLFHFNSSPAFHSVILPRREDGYFE